MIKAHRYIGWGRSLIPSFALNVSIVSIDLMLETETCHVATGHLSFTGTMSIIATDYIAGRDWGQENHLHEQLTRVAAASMYYRDGDVRGQDESYIDFEYNTINDKYHEAIR